MSSFEEVDIIDSMAWERASSAVAASTWGGRSAMRSASSTANSGTNWGEVTARVAPSTANIATRVASAPVPVVVGTMTSVGRPGANGTGPLSSASDASVATW